MGRKERERKGWREKRGKEHRKRDQSRTVYGSRVCSLYYRVIKYQSGVVRARGNPTHTQLERTPTRRPRQNVEK